MKWFSIITDVMTIITSIMVIVLILRKWKEDDNL